jgi:hypothetical protein
MDINKCLDLARKQASNAKDGTLKFNGTTYGFEFDRYQNVYIVTDLNTSEEITRLNTRKLTDARKWLKEYLSN